jgi:hypothetical protein
MRILKVNELNTETYLSAASKLRNKFVPGGNPKRSFELERFAFLKSKAPGEYWIYRKGDIKKNINECWIKPSIYFRSMSDINFEHVHVDDLKFLCDGSIYLSSFDPDPISYTDAKKGTIEIYFSVKLKKLKNDKVEVIVSLTVPEIYFHFSNRSEALRFKKNMIDWNWTRNKDYKTSNTKESDKIPDFEDLLWEYNVIENIRKEFNNLSVNYFYSE